MGIETLLKSVMDLSVTQPAELKGAGNITIPGAKADPADVDAFTRAMMPKTESAALVEPAVKTMSDTPVEPLKTLGNTQNLTSEDPKTKQWIETVTDIFSKDSLSPSDLYRVQVLAGLAQIEVKRNSSVTRGMDDGLKTLLKNT